MASENQYDEKTDSMRNGFRESAEDAINVLRSMISLEPGLEKVADICATALLSGHKLLVCGNGGSASEAQHLAGELVGRYKRNRNAWPALALTADSSLLTCIANDYCYAEVFSRQVSAFGRSQDVLIVFTTSGNSPNVLRALETARSIQMTTIAFLGRDGGAAVALADHVLLVPHGDTARIQEGHQFLMHSMMDILETAIS